MVANRFRLVRKLGDGAMGTVHLAEDRDGKQVAIKLLNDDVSKDPDTAARLAREAAATRAIDHPRVARAIEIGREPDGRWWLAMEYVEGRTLRDALAGGALRPRRALLIARQIIEALAAAHALGIVHRDVKPENVMLVPNPDGGFDEDSVKVLDFGIAKLDPSKHGHLGPSTVAGMVHGTPAYMAPEQIRREPLDGRCDIYALGAVLHEMIVGVPPFDGDDLTILSKHLRIPAPALTSPVAADQVTLAVRAFAARLLAKDAGARPNAATAIGELDAAYATIGSDAARIESMSLSTGRVIVAAGSLPQPRIVIRPPSARDVAAPSQTLVQRKTAKLVAFARSYGLAPRQLIFGFAVAFGLILLVMVVAITSAS